MQGSDLMKKTAMIIIILFLLVGRTGSVYAKEQFVMMPPTNLPPSPVSDQKSFMLIPSNDLSTYYLDNSRIIKYVNSRLLDGWIKKIMTEQDKGMEMKQHIFQNKVDKKLKKIGKQQQQMEKQIEMQQQAQIRGQRQEQMPDMDEIVISMQDKAKAEFERKLSKQDKEKIEMDKITYYQLIHQQFDPINFKYKVVEVYSYNVNSQLLPSKTIQSSWTTIPVGSIEEKVLACINDYIQSSVDKVIFK